MSYGIQVINSSGVVQIDQDYSNYQVIAQGVVPSLYEGGFGAQATDILLLRTQGVGTLRMNYANTTGVISYYSSTGYLKYAVARSMDQVAPSSETYGLRVYSSSGALVFDSGIALVAPVANILMPLTGETSTFSLPSSYRERYIEMGCLSPHTLRGPGQFFSQFIGPGIEFMSDGNIKVSSVVIGVGPPVNSGPWGTTRPALIAELT